MTKKIILFGGSFNPVHIGHIKISNCAAEKIGTDKVILIPANSSPFKQNATQESSDDRINMLKLAIRDYPIFEISNCEINRPSPSYTLDTVKYFRKQHGNSIQLHWLVGADVLDDLGKWYKINELMDQCIITVMCRGGFKKPELSEMKKHIGTERLQKLIDNMVETPALNISSSEIRNLIKHGQSTKGMLCKTVAEYIAKNKLYV